MVFFCCFSFPTVTGRLTRDQSGHQLLPLRPGWDRFRRLGPDRSVSMETLGSSPRRAAKSDGQKGGGVCRGLSSTRSVTPAGAHRRLCFLCELARAFRGAGGFACVWSANAKTLSWHFNLNAEKLSLCFFFSECWNCVIRFRRSAEPLSSCSNSDCFVTFSSCFRRMLRDHLYVSGLVFPMQLHAA